MKQTIMIITFALALCNFVVADTVEPVNCSAILQPSVSATATSTSLSGTFNDVRVKNTGSEDVGIVIEREGEDGASMTNFATAQRVISAGATATITNEAVTGIRHATSSGTSNLILERCKKQ